MSLKRYNDKRDFSKTKEPRSAKKADEKSKLRFVVQRHHATNLHYDFRLEMDGVLKSWAVPKGPSLNPADKRLAMMVEDHPYDYRTFEGEIPAGNYGGGVVDIFDEGMYEALGGGTEKDLLKELKTGSLKVVLHGKILKGEFALVRIKSEDSNAWLLIKHNDKYAVDKKFSSEDLVPAAVKKKGLDFKKRAKSGKGKPEAVKEEKADGAEEKKRNAEIRKAAEEMPETREETFGKKKVKLTNLRKLYWKKEGISKGLLINYYEQISGYILPYLKDKPLSLNRHPNGIDAPGFFQKDLDTDKIPSWIKSAPLYSESNDEDIDYLVCNDHATLLWMVNLGCIEINPWLSSYKKPENPLYAVLDLDPHDLDFVEVINVAQTAKAALDKMRIKSFIKTSGSKGLHIYIPIGNTYDYDISKNFIHYLGQILIDEHPDTTSLERNPQKRKNKIYLDFLQNRRGQTIAAPYSARPKPGATVSTPLEWDEVNEDLDLKNYTIFNTLDRINKKGDLWKGILTTKNNLQTGLKLWRGK